MSEHLWQLDTNEKQEWPAERELPKREWVGLTDGEMRELEKQFNAVTLPLENVSLTGF